MYMSHACRYFEWVAEIHKVLKHWHFKFHQQEINYNEVLSYASNHVRLVPLADTVGATTLVVHFQDVQKVKTTFLGDFELLNALLLRYIPGQPDVKWCSLPTLLEEYGVCLPPKAQPLIANKLKFPGQGGQIPDDQLGTPLHPSTNGLFAPGHDISLRLHKMLTLKELSGLVRAVDLFQRPLMDYLTMLVFFKLNKSALFDKYLRFHLKKITDVQLKELRAHEKFHEFKFSGFPSLASPSSAATPLGSFAQPSFAPPLGSFAPPPGSFAPSSFAPPSAKQDPGQGLPMDSLVKALESTRNLMGKIMLGSATYVEIIAEDKLMLQRLDIEREFAILSEYVLVSNLSNDHYKGLGGVQSMLELFQYSAHIKNIHSVCSQYHLKECTSDPLLQELVEIMQDYEHEMDRSNMTPLEAVEKMRRVKEILCLGEKTSSKCLDIFAAMADSAAFYQFVRDKQFYGQQGQAIFLQQYQLITAQLQHEEYDDQVLNHLFAAFKVITPFMDGKKEFTKLMEEVTALNAVNGLKQLETVNANITLIRLWFSRAEVRG